MRHGWSVLLLVAASGCAAPRNEATSPAPVCPRAQNGVLVTLETAERPLAGAEDGPSALTLVGKADAQ